MPQLGSEQPPGRSQLGVISLVPVKNTEFYQSQEWSNASYANRQVTDSYCTSIYINQGGACASWGSSTYNVTEMTSPAGWRNVTNSRSIDGLVVSTRIKAPFASFHVGPSEVVLVDGFHAEPPNADFDRQACSAVDGALLQCDLTAVALTRIPGRIESLARIDAASIGLVQLDKAIRRAQYRPSEVAAKPDKLKSTLGQDYVISVP
jgi:hypothetical protein